GLRAKRGRGVVASLEPPVVFRPAAPRESEQPAGVPAHLAEPLDAALALLLAVRGGALPPRRPRLLPGRAPPGRVGTGSPARRRVLGGLGSLRLPGEPVEPPVRRGLDPLGRLGRGCGTGVAVGAEDPVLGRRGGRTRALGPPRERGDGGGGHLDRPGAPRRRGPGPPPGRVGGAGPGLRYRRFGRAMGAVGRARVAIHAVSVRVASRLLVDSAGGVVPAVPARLARPAAAAGRPARRPLRSS